MPDVWFYVGLPRIPWSGRRQIFFSTALDIDYSRWSVGVSSICGQPDLTGLVLIQNICTSVSRAVLMVKLWSEVESSGSKSLAVFLASKFCPPVRGLYLERCYA